MNLGNGSRCWIILITYQRQSSVRSPQPSISYDQSNFLTAPMLIPRPRRERNSSISSYISSRFFLQPAFWQKMESGLLRLRTIRKDLSSGGVLLLGDLRALHRGDGIRLWSLAGGSLSSVGAWLLRLNNKENIKHIRKSASPSHTTSAPQ